MANKFFKKSLIGLIIISFVFSNIIFSFPQKAQAQWVVFDPTNFGANLTTATNETSKSIKEFLGDTVAWFAANLVIRQITNRTVKWINSGFKGNPFYITPADLLKDTADQAFGLFLSRYGKLERLLCYDFGARVKLALVSNFYRSGFQSYESRMLCTMSRVVDNIQRFENNFLYGGWSGWIELTQPRGNPFGIYFESMGELNRAILAGQEQANTEVSWGQGFLSQKKCIAMEVLPEGVMGPPACIQWEIQTPGSTIEKELNDALGSGKRRLEVADEINEIIGALLSQLMTSGLRSLTSGGREPVTREEVTPSMSQETKSWVAATVDNSLTNERIYLTTKQDSLNTINTIISKLGDWKACYEEKLAALRSETVPDQTKISAAEDILRRIEGSEQNYENERIRIESEIAESNILINERESVKTSISTATTYEEISEIYDSDIASELRTSQDYQNAQEENKTLKEKVDEINQEYEECLNG